MHSQTVPRPYLESFEDPNRLKLTIDYLDKNSILKNDDICVFKPKVAESSDLLKVHSPYLLQIVENISERGGGEVGNSSLASEDTFHLSCLAAGGAMLSSEIIVKENINFSFALIRPPGHHAGVSRAAGLCFFNNIAIAVENLRANYGFQKFLILDFDTHFGDGTSEIFYSDPSVLYISFHEYEERGFFDEIGHGAGEGLNINLPLPLGTSDDGFILAFESIFEPLAKSFNPDLMLISAGFDGHFADPVGNMNLTSRAYEIVTKKIKEMKKRAVFILEGGYSLIALPISIAAVISALIDVEFTPFDLRFAPSFPRRIEKVEVVLKEAYSFLSDYWDIF